jgi:hypothetical protein
MFLSESLLDGAKAIERARQPFYCADILPVGLHCQQSATFHGLTIEQNCAGTTIGRVTTDVSAREARLFSDEVNQQHAIFDFVFVLTRIY